MTKRFGEKNAEVVAAEKALKISDNRKAIAISVK